MAGYSTKMRVFQSFGVAPNGTATEQNVFVFGPKYDLHRYTDDDEKEQMTPFRFEQDWGASGATSFADAFDVSINYKLDHDSVRVFAENAYVGISANAIPVSVDGEEESTTTNVAVSGSYLGSGTAGATVLFYGTDLTGASASLARGVKAGDYVGFQKPAATASDSAKTYFVRVASDATLEGSDSVVVLAEGLPDGIISDSELAGDVVVFLLEKSASVELASGSWDVTGATLTIKDQSGSAAGYACKVGSAARPLVAGDIYVSYRTMDMREQASIDVLTSVSSVERVLGKADPENPISMGVMNAFIGGAPVVYYYVTPGDDSTAIAGALKRAELQRTLYYLVPMTQNQLALDTVVSHAKSMSNEEEKRWRIVFLCSDVGDTETTSVSVVGFGSYTQDGTAYQTIKTAADVGTVSRGDEIVLATGGTFTVSRKLNATTVLCEETYDASRTATGAISATITHELSDTEYATAVAGAAKRYGTFRAVDCFPKTYGYDGERYSSMFLAPIFAGIAASVSPQTPITNASVPGVDDIPETYSGFGETELDTIAAGGVMIAMQDLRGDNVYIRKQLTTGAADGNILTAELSCVKNADSVSLVFSNVLDGFRGSYNVTPGLLDLVETSLTSAIHELQNNADNELVGPQLLGDSEVTDIYVDPTNATRIIARIRCVLPAPFNEMDLYLSFQVTSEVEAVQAEQTTQTEE